MIHKHIKIGVIQLWNGLPMLMPCFHVVVSQ